MDIWGHKLKYFSKILSSLLAGMVILLSLSSCIVEEDLSKSIKGISQTSIDSVRIAGRSIISYNETVSFKAAVSMTGDAALTYLWTVTQGSDYLLLSDSESKKITVQANNTTANEQTAQLQVTVSDGTNSMTAVHQVTITEKGVTLPPESIPAYTDTIYINLTDGLVSSEDVSGDSSEDSSWQQIGVGAEGEIVFSDECVLVRYTKDDDGNSTGLIKIDASAFDGDFTVKLAGRTDKGGVKLQTNADYKTNVYLNAVTINSTDYPCLDITKGGTADIYLEGENSFTDGRKYGIGYGEDYSTEGSDNKGTLFCKGDLNLMGSGTLTVTQAYKNCIASKANLTVNGGTYLLSSNGKNGLCGDASVTINDGDITFNGSGSISSSTFRKANAIKADTDDSSSAVYIKGGKLNLTTYNGKGISASKVYISGGNSVLSITGVSDYTNDNHRTSTYYDADGVKYSNVSVTFAAEGIEGASIIEITGGSVSVTATDDALNVSDSSGNFNMKGGSLYCYAQKGDGVDCNGSISISGGLLVSYAPTGSEDALDCGDQNGSIKISGGTIAACCGSSNALRDISVSNQRLLYFTGTSSGMGGAFGGGMGGPGGNRPGSASSTGTSSVSFSKIAVKASDSASASDKWLYAYELPSSSFGLFFMTSPDFTSSSASDYSVYSNPTFTGGSNFHGLYSVSEENTEMPSISSGSLIDEKNVAIK